MDIPSINRGEFYNEKTIGFLLLKQTLVLSFNTWEKS